MTFPNEQNKIKENVYIHMIADNNIVTGSMTRDKRTDACARVICLHEADRQTGRQTGRQTDRQTDTRSCMRMMHAHTPKRLRE